MITTGPPFVVTISSLRMMFVPVKWIPPAPFVFKSPFKVVVPLPAVWVIVDAVMLDAVKFVALTIVKSPIRVEAPAAPVKVMFPVPAVKLSEPGPSTVVEKMISPEPPVLSDAIPVNDTPLPNWM